MRFNRLVVNASPLIVLTKSGLLDIVESLADEWIVPQPVFDEITKKPDVSPARIEKLPKLSVPTVSMEPCVLGWDLGNGESSVLAFSQNNHLPVCIDDRAAWRCAQTLGLPTIGTIGLLLRAKKAGLLPTIKAGISQLQNAGLWLSPAFVQQLLIREKEL